MRFLLAWVLLLGACGDPVVDCPDGEVEIERRCVRVDGGISDVGVDVPVEDAGEVDANVDGCMPTTETCDGTDEDCDGDIDEMVLTTFYVDADGDGQGDPSRTCEACAAEECEAGLTWVTLGEDCDDDCDVCSPDLTESCDDLDNDCDENVDEGVTTTYYLDTDDDMFGDDAMTMEACERPEGYADVGGDCAVEDPDAYPGQTTYFDHAVMVVGGFDYDCNTTDDYAINVAAPPLCEAGSCPSAARWRDSFPPCGGLATTWSCLTFMGVCQGDAVETGGVRALCR